MKQIFQASYPSALGYLYPYTSNLRILVNGVQIGKTYNPVKQKGDLYLPNVLTLNSYAGQW